MNWLSWQVADMGPEYARVCKHLVSRQDALKDYLSIIHHPERHLIWRAIDYQFKKDLIHEVFRF
jgi:hypothetical protein